MKLCKIAKDGGRKSRVLGYWLIEWKGVFSIVLLRFDDGTREAYHEHAFNAVSWLLKGRLEERCRHECGVTIYLPSWRPIWTPRHRFHQVKSVGRSWVLSFRGPWASTWSEYDSGTKRLSTLTHGRRVLFDQ